MATDDRETPHARFDHSDTTEAAAPDARVSVMDWLLDVGESVARKFRGPALPRSPLARIHGR